ncbi:hypothetical protein AMJ80_04260 [bacterium SM23_31]|nr:MAG: hypothetical protein AMJ80_04260 [bacterium SM23_31]
MVLELNLYKVMNKIPFIKLFHGIKKIITTLFIAFYLSFNSLSRLGEIYNPFDNQSTPYLKITRAQLYINNPIPNGVRFLIKKPRPH